MIGYGGAWTLGTLIGMPIGVIVFIGAVVAAYASIRANKRAMIAHDNHKDRQWRGEYDGLGWSMVIWSCIATSVIAFVITAAGMFPYDQDFHRLRPISGTVESIDIKEWSSQYAITFKEGATVRCDDTRCATIKVGDHINLVCTKEYVYGAVAGWGCKWGGNTAVAWKWTPLTVPRDKPCQRPASHGCKR